MLVNKTQSSLVIGRFRIMPGDKVPATALSDKEQKSVEAFVRKGFLVEEANKVVIPEVKHEFKPKQKAKPVEIITKPVIESKPAEVVDTPKE